MYTLNNLSAIWNRSLFLFPTRREKIFYDSCETFFAPRLLIMKETRE